jgi:hypothetical protein
VSNRSCSHRIFFFGVSNTGSSVSLPQGLVSVSSLSCSHLTLTFDRSGKKGAYGLTGAIFRAGGGVGGGLTTSSALSGAVARKLQIMMALIAALLCMICRNLQCSIINCAPERADGQLWIIPVVAKLTFGHLIAIVFETALARFAPFAYMEHVFLTSVTLFGFEAAGSGRSRRMV